LRKIKITEQMIGSASHAARPSYCPVTELVTSRVPVPLCWLRGELCKISAISSVTKQTKKRRLGKDLGQRALKANISAEKQTLT